jgi:hypothetical protein
MPQLLEPVGAGQTRFRLHGLAPDARGIAVGREALLIFDGLDRLVAFLGAYSEEASLDDLLPTTTVEQARRSTGGVALVLRCAAADGYAIDRLARLAAIARGRVYVGSGRTFVRARERKAPFGYDLAVAPSQLGLEGEGVAVVDRDYAVQYDSESTIDPIELVQRLALRPVALPAGGVGADPERCGLRDLALVLVAPGVADRVVSFLWRRRVPFAGVRVALGDDEDGSLLLRLRQPDPSILDILRPIPGVELHVPVSPRAAVELGYRHPIHLASANTCLPGDEMCLFRGRTRRVERLDGAPRFVDGRHLVRSDLAGRLREIEGVRGGELEALRVDLRLQFTGATREAKAVLVPWEQIDLLRRLIYAIPPHALAVASIVPLSDGLLVLASRPGVARRMGGIELGALIPLGRRFIEVGPGVLVPDGYELWPRVRPQLVRELLSLGSDDLALFTDESRAPLRVDAESLSPLDAAAVAELALEGAAQLGREVPAREDARIVNDRLGRFSLWGFRRGSKGIEPEPESDMVALEAATGEPEDPTLALPPSEDA